jgi:hypothetical protein
VKCPLLFRDVRLSVTFSWPQGTEDVLGNPAYQELRLSVADDMEEAKRRVRNAKYSAYTKKDQNSDVVPLSVPLVIPLNR